MFADFFAKLFLDTNQTTLVLEGAVSMIRTEALLFVALGAIWTVNSALLRHGKGENHFDLQHYRAGFQNWYFGVAAHGNRLCRYLDGSSHRLGIGADSLFGLPDPVVPKKTKLSPCFSITAHGKTVS